MGLIPKIYANFPKSKKNLKHFWLQVYQTVGFQPLQIHEKSSYLHLVKWSMSQLSRVLQKPTEGMNENDNTELSVVAEVTGNLRNQPQRTRWDVLSASTKILQKL